MIALFAIAVFELIALVVLTVLYIEQQGKIEQLKLSNKIGIVNDDELRTILKSFNLDKVNLDELKKALLATMVTGGLIIPQVPPDNSNDPLATSRYPHILPTSLETKKI